MAGFVLVTLSRQAAEGPGPGPAPVPGLLADSGRQ